MQSSVPIIARNRYFFVTARLKHESEPNAHDNLT